MITTQTVMEAFGWTIIHSFWQISLIGLLLKVCLIIFRKKSPNISYNLALTGLITIIVVFSLTFIKYIPLNNNSQYNHMEKEMTNVTFQNNPEFQKEESIHGSSETEVGFTKVFLDFAEENIKLVVIFWLVGFLIFSIRFMGSYLYISRIRSKYTSKVYGTFKDLLETIKSNLGINHSVQLLESATTKIPIVIGYLKPAIILPIGLTTSIPFNQLEAILVHEMAHIRRNDFLINLIRSIFESVLFYHPVFWWISHVIDTEREHCCDDITIAYCEKPDSLQQALVNLYEFNQQPIPIAAALYSNKYQLLNRIKRMKTKNLPEGSLWKTNHGKRGNLFSILILMAGVILIMSTSAFSPRPADIPQLPVEFEIPSVDYSVEPLEVMDKSETLIPEKEKVIKPDSTNSKKKAIISLELDEDGNLVQISKDGKPLEGEEKEKYEKLTAKMNDLKDEEKALQENKERLEEIKLKLKEKEFMMQEMHEEYNQVMKEYIALSEKLAGQHNSDNKSLFDNESYQFKEFDELAHLNEDLPLLYEQVPFPESLLEKEDIARFNEELFNDQFMAQQERLDEIFQDLENNQLLQHDRYVDILEHFEDFQELNKIDMNTHLTEVNIRKELKKDGLLADENDELVLELSTKRLIINGTKQPKDIHQKYLNIYNKYSPSPITDKTQVIITD
ncbi:MAG: M56 family metallopeptidase [Bacteroidales bacterium]